jgi:hypothetical protein
MAAKSSLRESFPHKRHGPSTSSSGIIVRHATHSAILPRLICYLFACFFAGLLFTFWIGIGAELAKHAGQIKFEKKPMGDCNHHLNITELLAPATDDEEWVALATGFNASPKGTVRYPLLVYFISLYISQTGMEPPGSHASWSSLNAPLRPLPCQGGH